MTGEAPALVVKQLSAGYQRTEVLRDVSLTVPVGSLVLLAGANGAGKSTLLKAVAGLLRATGGTIHMFGTDVTALPPHERVRRGLCLIPEGRGVYGRLTVRENLIMQSMSGDQNEALARAAEAFPILGRRLGQLAGTLSGGEQRMLALARAFVRRPRLIVVDELSLGLAPRFVDEVFGFLERLAREQGVPTLVVDQFVNRVLDIASIAYVLDRGQIVRVYDAQELKGGQRGVDLFGPR